MAGVYTTGGYSTHPYTTGVYTSGGYISHTPLSSITSAGEKNNRKDDITLNFKFQKHECSTGPSLPSTPVTSILGGPYSNNNLRDLDEVSQVHSVPVYTVPTVPVYTVPVPASWGVLRATTISEI